MLSDNPLVITLDEAKLDREFEALLDEMYLMYHVHPTNIPDYDGIELRQKREAWKHTNDAYPPEGWHYQEEPIIPVVIRNKHVWSDGEKALVIALLVLVAWLVLAMLAVVIVEVML